MEKLGPGHITPFAAREKFSFYALISISTVSVLDLTIEAALALEEIGLGLAGGLRSSLTERKVYWTFRLLPLETKKAKQTNKTHNKNTLPEGNRLERSNPWNGAESHTEQSPGERSPQSRS